MSRNNVIALVLAILLPSVTWGQATNPSPEDASTTERIDELIARLGSPIRKERELASEELARLGQAALPALEEVVDHPDAEIRRRATELVDRLRAEIASAATLLDLDWKTLPLRLAVEDLAKKTGLPLKLHAPQAKAGRPDASRWITLQEKNVPLLKALDHVARVGSLQIRWPPKPDMPILLAPGPVSDIRASYDGPFGVRLRGLELRRSIRFDGNPQRSSRLELQFEVVAEPHVTLLATRPMILTEVIDDKGRLLSPQGAQARRTSFGPQPTWGIRSPMPNRSFQLRAQLALEDPTIERLQSLEGEVTVDLITGRDLALTIDNIEEAAGESHEIEGATVEVEEIIVTDQQLEISLKIEQSRTPRGDSGGAFYRDSFEFVDQNGDTLPANLITQANTRVQSHLGTTQLKLRALRSDGQEGPWRLRIHRAQSHLYTIPFHLATTLLL